MRGSIRSAAMRRGTRRSGWRSTKRWPKCRRSTRTASSGAISTSSAPCSERTIFQTGGDGVHPATTAFKVDATRIEGLPEPHPFAEIFVYSPDVEGVHLRFGRIARGGIRWSDRPEDFRTEVLGLAKAQNVKNAVIVPVGAKGGFVPKKLPQGGTREAVQAEAVRAYTLFISSLLDITDNLVDGKIMPPADVVRHDGDDPYLVVAADKGTASFSDIANGISAGHRFWLDDAFASGGSAGYDHKKMAITARGAWEAVKRHFREMDIDIQSTPFTVIGIGDMSGDVFGNGMLLSRHIRLRAAFDHRDIFIDPDPDPQSSYAERDRLFQLPRSSWQDYDRAKISKGGGIFSRQAKSIPLTPELAQLTGLKGESATPQQVVHALLTVEMDLLWFGGIGTFVKATSESHADVGDRANDAVRIDATELRAKVVGEGANLALTQRARIEYALAGGRLNTDAIDNSAGVNSSDLEVNIKIALRSAEASGKLTRAKRNELLTEMTDEVAGLVLRNNYLQTLSLTLSRGRGTEENGFVIQLMHDLEERQMLDRRLEFASRRCRSAGARRAARNADPPGTRRPPGAQQDRALRRPLEEQRSGRRVSGPGAEALFSGADVRRIQARDREPSPEARDRRDAAFKQHDQPRRDRPSCRASAGRRVQRRRTSPPPSQ